MEFRLRHVRAVTATDLKKTWSLLIINVQTSRIIAYDDAYIYTRDLYFDSKLDSENEIRRRHVHTMTAADLKKTWSLLSIYL